MAARLLLCLYRVVQLCDLADSGPLFRAGLCRLERIRNHAAEEAGAGKTRTSSSSAAEEGCASSSAAAASSSAAPRASASAAAAHSAEVCSAGRGAGGYRCAQGREGTRGERRRLLLCRLMHL